MSAARKANQTNGIFKSQSEKQNKAIDNEKSMGGEEEGDTIGTRNKCFYLKIQVKIS